ncbi:regulator of G-protein signaling 2 [Amia ocellicauda]|uniref:regulator of G-protein signaling 2 n=1 Tax=Amia ocellicauda TaxID=2972642 RepID=UPI003463D7FE
MQTALYLVMMHQAAHKDLSEASDILVENKRNRQKDWRSRLRYFLQRPSTMKTSFSRRKSYRPTADEVNEWAQSLEILLAYKYGLAAFRIFLKSEFCEENLEFWLACEDFRKITSPAKTASRAKWIYEEFIMSEAPKEINLDFYTKDAITQNLQLPTPSCFSAAQKRVYYLMENNSYPRFLQSEIYKELRAVSLGEGKYLKT